MDKITVKKDNRKSLVDDLVRESLNEIAENAERGFSTTELSFDKQIAGDVKSEIEKQLKESGTDYTWVIMRQEPKPYGGFGFNYFISETIGDTRTYKLKIIS